MDYEKMAEELADDLRGTCKSLPLDYMDMPLEFHRYLDDRVFLCATCGWWYDASEESEDQYGEQVCLECEEESEG